MVTQGTSDADKTNDIQILNRSLFFEYRAVWAYRFGAEKLSNSEVGRAVMALALENKGDHEKHQGLLTKAINDLGGAPVQIEKTYDLSSYINRGDGNVDSDVNIAKLALALEIGAAAGYIGDTAQLRLPAMIELEASIAAVEAVHAARIRAAFNSLGIKIAVVPSPVVNAKTRPDWVIKV